MTCPRGAAGLRFMVTTDAEKFNPESRKLIRSHVMMGKNLGKTRPPRKRREEEGVFESRPVLQPPTTIPRKFGSDASTICVADAVKPGTVEVVLHCECSPRHLCLGANGSPSAKPSLVHSQAGPVPSGDMHTLREEGRAVDSAFSSRSCLPPRQDFYLTLLFRRGTAPEILLC